MKVDFKLDESAVKQAISQLGAKFPAVARRALARAGTSGRAEMARLIAQDMGIGAARVKRDIRLVYIGSTSVVIETQGVRLPLIEFGARGPEPSRGRGRGVSYRLPGGRGRAEKAFIATMHSGHRGVFQRTGRLRVPVYELHGPSINLVFGKFLPQGQAAAEESLAKNFQSELNHALSMR